MDEKQTESSLSETLSAMALDYSHIGATHRSSCTLMGHTAATHRGNFTIKQFYIGEMHRSNSSQTSSADNSTQIYTEQGKCIDSLPQLLEQIQSEKKSLTFHSVC